MKLIRNTAMAFFCILSIIKLDARTEIQVSSINENNKKIVVEIDYGNNMLPRKVEIPLIKGKTALELLQAVASVKTQRIGNFVFVVSIDGIEGKRGEMAWYYLVDDKSPGELPNSKILNGTERIKWSFKKDVCSGKVDGK